MANNNNKFVSRENAKTLWGYMIDLLTGKYTKPSGGIPKSDLESSVQTSLGKADTALQSFTETDPTVPSWAKQSSKPSYNADEISSTGTTNQFVTDTEKNTWNGKGTYSKPSGGIPKTDLASAVQTSLGKADSALQSETDPTVPSWAKASNPPITSEQVAQISTNQSDILTLEKRNGVINLLNFNNCAKGQVRSVSYEITGDGSVIVNGTPTAGGPSYIILYLDNDEVHADEYCDGKHVLYGCPAGGSESTYCMYVSRSSYVKYDTGSGVVMDATALTGVLVVIRISDGYTANNLVFKPAIIDKALWDSGFTSPITKTLSNFELTPALIEKVDSGVKNTLSIPTSQTISNITYTKDSDEYVTSNSVSDYRGWTTTSANVSYNLKKGNYVIVCYPKSTNTLGVTFAVMTSTGFPVNTTTADPSSGKLAVEFSLNTDDTVYIMYKPGQQKARFMICTLAEWKVSQSFVPYRALITGVYAVMDKAVECSTTETTTGIKFVASEKGNYRITASAMYSSSKPSTLRVKQKYSSSGETFYNFLYTESSTNTASLSVCGVKNLDVGGAFEVFAKYEQAASNSFFVLVEKIG